MLVLKKNRSDESDALIGGVDEVDIDLKDARSYSNISITILNNFIKNK